MRNLYRYGLLALSLLAGMARASVGMTELPAGNEDGPVTVFYPSRTEAKTVQRGSFSSQLAPDSAPVAGNRRLIIVSPGSGSTPWANADLAQMLVSEGFVVAMPEHKGDNYKDPSEPGPRSWKRRPLEVSHAIDAVAKDARFAPLLSFDKVGMYGMSAGGHTALTLAGGRWSPAQLLRHCQAHIDDDFQACVGLSTELSGGWLDGLKERVALWVLQRRLNDSTWYAYQDPRIAAIVAGVPFAADFDPASLATPRVPLALVTARKDKWLNPQYHSDAVLKACSGCIHLADLATGGHGALLSPLPPHLSGTLGDLVNDPPGFDRSVLPALDHKITTFFRHYLAAE
jgi:predicted dienelactone hydrolase